jgi:hypothetical protein
MRSLIKPLAFVPILSALIAIGIVAGFRIYEKLSAYELVTVIIYPLFVAVAVALVADWSAKSALEQFRREFTELLAQTIKGISRSKIVWHGTKYNVPDSNIFWNNLLERSYRRFYLVGKTNKSWVDKDEAQSQNLADNILRILAEGGTVRIASIEDAATIDRTLVFLRKYVGKALQLKDSATRKRIANSAESRFSYVTYAHANYGAVLADDRLFLIPALNSDEFRPDSPVFEIDRNQHNQAFENLLADIERFVRAGNTKLAGLSNLGAR